MGELLTDALESRVRFCSYVRNKDPEHVQTQIFIAHRCDGFLGEYFPGV